MDTTTSFNSVEDECRYWKERAKQYHKEYTDVKQEYDEYVEQSRQMEAEMDATLDQKQDIIKDLRMKVSALENEVESLKLKFESQSTEVATMEKQFESVKKERDSMKENMRSLEQKNDDLERAHRILNETIADFGRMLDKEYEKNALLEHEIDEKEALQERIQRLMDETRDLKQEINVKSRHQTNGVVGGVDGSSALNGELINDVVTGTTTTTTQTAQSIDNTNHHHCRSNHHNHNNHHHQHNNQQQHHHLHRNNSSSNNKTTTANFNEYKQQQQSLKNPDNLINGNAMSASSRTTALNIVADMLRKLNLDRALLCPQCSRFRCICESPPPSTHILATTTTTTCPTADTNLYRTTTTTNNDNNNTLGSVAADAESSLKRFSRSLTNTLASVGGGSCSGGISATIPNPDSNTKKLSNDVTAAAATNCSSTDDSLNNYRHSTETLNSTSSSNSNSLTMRPNIFKRFTERLSLHSNQSPTENAATAPAAGTND